MDFLTTTIHFLCQQNLAQHTKDMASCIYILACMHCLILAFVPPSPGWNLDLKALGFVAPHVLYMHERLAYGTGWCLDLLGFVHIDIGWETLIDEWD